MNPITDIEVCKHLTTQLNLTTTVDFFPKQKKHALPMEDKL